MEQILLSIFAFFSTLLGGFVGLKNQDKLHKLLGYTAGVMLGVVAFDILPEIFKTTEKYGPTGSMIALVVGFLLFHFVEKSILIHHSNENNYPVHKHPDVGVISALALCGHSFLDGIGIGIGFQASKTVGIAVAIAVIAHDFTDGLNTVNLMIMNKNKSSKAMYLLFLDAVAPILGVIATLFITFTDRQLSLYLGFFAGFLLYICSSEILPEAHSKRSSYSTIGYTLLGVIFIYIVTRFIQ